MARIDKKSLAAPRTIAFVMDDAGRLQARAAMNAELGVDGTLRVHIGGRWELGEGLPSTRDVERALAAPEAPRAVRFETAELQSWDSSVLLVLRRIDRLCRDRRVAVALEGLPEGARRLLALADAVPPKGAASAPETPPWLARLGETARAAWDGTRESIAFLGETAIAFARLATGRAALRARDVALVAQDCGPQALGIVTLINFLVGVIVAFVGAIELRRFGAGIYVATSSQSRWSASSAAS